MIDGPSFIKKSNIKINLYRFHAIRTALIIVVVDLNIWPKQIMPDIENLQLDSGFPKCLSR